MIGLLRRASAVLATVALMVVLVPGSPARAHVVAVHSSTPAHQEVVTEVATITIEFVDGVDTGTAVFTLRGADGTDHAMTAPEFSQDETTVTLTPSEVDADGLPEGRYRAGYQVNFGDGHLSQGVIEFEVSRSGESQADPWPSDDPAPGRLEPERTDVSGQLPWLIGIGAVVVVGFAVAIVIQRRRSARK